MLEKTLHGGNIAAAFAIVATTADLTVTGGAATTISAALSGVSIFKSADKDTKALAKEMAKVMEHQLARGHLTDARRKVVAQMLATYPPDKSDMVRDDLDASQIAATQSAKVAETATDPAHKTPTALKDFRDILQAALEPVLDDPALSPDLQPAVVKELLSRIKQSGREDKLRDEGITDKAIIRLAQRRRADTEDVGRAWLELQNAMDDAVRVQQDGRTTTNHGDFVDVVIKRVAELAADGAYIDAGTEIDTALLQEDADHAARTTKLIESGIKIARLESDPRKAADLVIKGLRNNGDPDAYSEQFYNTFLEWHNRGDGGGLTFDAEVALRLATVAIDRAQGAGQHSNAQNCLGLAYHVLGNRSVKTTLLEQAVEAYREAASEFIRLAAPLDWALIMTNLGTALKDLGERESGLSSLEQSDIAYLAALNVQTKTNAPTKWAMTQNNRGTLLKIVGERTKSSPVLKQSLNCYEQALSIWNRVDAPEKWAMVKNNVGTVLTALWVHDKIKIHIDNAISALENALQIRSQEKIPIEWAKTQMNLGNAYSARGDSKGSLSDFQQALEAYNQALNVFTQDRTPLECAKLNTNIAQNHCARFELNHKEDDLDFAQEAATTAIRVYREIEADFYIEKVMRLISRIEALRGGLPG